MTSPSKVKRKKKWTHFLEKAPASTSAAVLVLGGGLQEDGSLPEWGVRRVQLGRELQLQQGSACPLLCLGAGTPHKPAVITRKGHILHEASAYSEHLVAQGAPRHGMLKEMASYDTIGNAFFALTIHAIPLQWRRLAVVTSNFHMPRTQGIFNHIFALGGEALHQDRGWFLLDYHAAPDAGIFSDDVLEARTAREHESLLAWQENCRRLKSLEAMHAFLHHEHLCYAVERQHEFLDQQDEVISQEVLKSY
ncbi:hypothetical protein WJX84_002481 [Apatococcus fuscideae]|uniref:DUF218 domain-containing protein n=1 Tax=Apatococcus fuscideae TaxID=2026836 RepID=A0AAW1SLA2_9CHLO